MGYFNSVVLPIILSSKTIFIWFLSHSRQLIWQNSDLAKAIKTCWFVVLNTQVSGRPLVQKKTCGTQEVMLFGSSAAVFFLFNKQKNTSNKSPAVHINIATFKRYIGINIKSSEKTSQHKLDWQVNSGKYMAGTPRPQQWTIYTKDTARMTK